jgi:hypothetical protein
MNMLTIKNYFYSVLLTALWISIIPAARAQRTFTKEISQEVAASKGSLIRIVGNSRKLTIKSWEQPKLKVTVELISDSSGVSMANEKWFEDLGISIKPFSTRVDIFTTSFSPTRKMPAKVYNPGEKKPITADKRITKTPAMQKGEYYPGRARYDIRSMTVTVPAGAKLDLENKYGDVVIAMNLEEARLEISNGTLDAQDIKKLTLTSDFCNANLGNLGKAEVEFYNGTFRALNIDDLDMDSRSSTIEYEKGNYAYLRSQTDEVSIREINKVDGRKVYGSIKVDQLNGSFDLEGNNVDVKFRNISPAVSLIRIDNKYADLRLPVKDLKNYFVDFTGYYSTVFAGFQKQVIKEDEAKEDVSADKEKPKVFETKRSQPGMPIGELAPHRFTGTVGDIKGKHTRIELTCNSCTVDFK